MSEVVDYVYETLNAELKQQARNIRETRKQSERSETAGGVASSTLADAPLAVDGGMSGGDLLWITDGRKPAEGAGAGTGVLACYNPATDQWLNVNDYSAVVV